MNNNVNTTAMLPAALAERNMQANFNNMHARAMAEGDPRQAVKQYDRAGLSRGAGLWNQAGIDAANKMAPGVANAYTDRLAQDTANESMQMQGQAQREQQAQALGALQENNAYAQQLAALQRQQSSNNLVTSVLGGLLN